MLCDELEHSYSSRILTVVSVNFVRYLLELSDYETHRISAKSGTNRDQDAGEEPGRRRCPSEFQLPCSLRHQILREECAHDCKDAQASNTQCTEAEINACLREVQKTKMQRRSSFALHETEHIQIFVESAYRKFRRLMQRCGRSKNVSSVEKVSLSIPPVNPAGENSPPNCAAAIAVKSNNNNETS